MIKNRSVLILLLTFLFFTTYQPILFSQETKNDQSSLAWQLEFADGLFLRGMFSTAVEEYQKILPKITEPEKVRQINFKMAEAYFKNNQYEKATQAFQQYITQYPEHPSKEEALFFISMMHYMQAHFQEAVRGFEELDLELLSSKYQAMRHYYLGVSLKEVSSDDRAIEVLQKVTDNDEVQLRALALTEITQIYLAQQKVDHAIQTMEEITEKYPDVSGIESVYLNLGKSYFQLGEFESAYQAFLSGKEQLSDKEELNNFNYGLLKSMFQLEKYSEFLELFEVCHLEEFDFAVRQELYYLEASVHFKKQAYDVALDKYRKMAETAETYSLEQDVLLQIMWCYYYLDDLQELEKSYQVFDEKYPNSLKLSEASFLKGEIYFRHQKFEESIAAYEKAHGVNPAFRYSDLMLYQKGRAKEAAGLLKEAFQIFEEYVEKYPKGKNLENVYVKLIAISGDLQKPGKVIEYSDKLIEKFPKFKQLEKVYLKKIETEYQAELYDQMRGTLESFVEKFPDSSFMKQAQFYLGWYFLNHDQYQLAVEWLEKSLSTELGKGLVTDPEVEVHLGMAYYFLKNYQKASQYLKSVFNTEEKRKIPKELLLWLGEYEALETSYTFGITVYEYCLQKALSDEERQRVLFQLAKWYFDVQDWTKAESYYRQVYENYPESDLALFSKLGFADTLRKKAAYVQAREVYQSIQNTEVPFVKARVQLGLGDLYEVAGQKEEALRSYLFVTILFDDPIVAEALFKAYQLNKELDREEDAAKNLSELKERFPASPFLSQVTSN